MSRRGVAVGLVDLEHHQEVLLDGHAAEDRRFLRQVSEAKNCAPVIGKSVMSSPSRMIRPLSGFTSPMIEQKQVRLASAIGAEQPDDRAAPDVERDVVEHRAGGHKPWRSSEPRARP